MKIYTKAGDSGKTRLIGGAEVQKSDWRIEAYGTLDELNSFLGLALAQNLPSPSSDRVRKIQSELFNIGSQLACQNSVEFAKILQSLPQISNHDIARLENEIDEMTSDLTPLKNFILPGGALAASTLHVARTVCRRAERTVVRLMEAEPPGPLSRELNLVYLNRLSDYLFTLARWVNQKNSTPEILWKSP